MSLKFIILLMVIPMVLGNFATKTIKENGYSVEIHTIKTKDGYILNTYRIPCGRKCVKPNDKPVLLAHGMLGSCEQYMMLGNNSLAFLLADQGYDVWMMNVRGTDHSRKHKYLTGKQYWDFSWHEIALYDLGQNIDYILNYTMSNDLFYVGHSMGCTLLMVLASEKPEYNSKIKLAQLMSPGVLVHHFNYGMLGGIAQLSDFLSELFNFLHLYELPLPNWTARDLFKTYCFRNDDFYKACQIFASAAGGDMMHSPNKVDLEAVFSFFPQPMSTRQLLHFAQGLRDGKFQKYHYGSKKNLRIYGEESPPAYNLSRVVLPIVLYTSKGDSIVTDEAVRALSTELPNVVALVEVELEKFNHIDYVLAPEAKKLVFDKILWYFLQFMK